MAYGDMTFGLISKPMNTYTVKENHPLKGERPVSFKILARNNSEFRKMAVTKIAKHPYTTFVVTQDDPKTGMTNMLAWMHYDASEDAYVWDDIKGKDYWINPKNGALSLELIS